MNGFLHLRGPRDRGDLTPRAGRPSPIRLTRALLSALATLLVFAATATVSKPVSAGLVPGTQPFCLNPSFGGGPGFEEEPISLKCVVIPQPVLDPATDLKAFLAALPYDDPYFLKTSTLPTIIRNKAAAIALGKALFWDKQVGSDGLACASCHYAAGADPMRTKNQRNPGLRNASGETGIDGLTPIGNVFDVTYSGKLTEQSGVALFTNQFQGPNYTLRKADFPFTRYEERDSVEWDGMAPQMDRKAPRTYDTDDVVSSAGVYHSTFNSLSPDGTKDKCNRRFPTSGPDVPLFNVNGISVRQVEPRNAPTVVNAVFNHRQFWDGRANNVFNGLDPFGARRPFPMPYTDTTQAPPTEIRSNTWNATKKSYKAEKIRIFSASLASQAVGPALSDFEMSCGGKQFPMLGRKMLSVVPLQGQIVAKTDSVLGAYKTVTDATGLTTTYKTMIQAAFAPKYWNAPDTQLQDGFTLMENNFSLFWGLAIQAYEATLVSDNAKFDQAREGADVTLSDAEVRGMNVYFGAGKCAACHLGPEFTAASVTHVQGGPGVGKYLERMLMGDGGIALYDSGFYNIGVRPTKEDIGVGGTDPYGFPLSFTRNAKSAGNANGSMISGMLPDPFTTNSEFFDPEQPNLGPVDPYERDAVDGAFKTPTLRNVELTGPYFHNGGQATLEQVIEFYNRGGDRKDFYTVDPWTCVMSMNDATGLLDSTGFFQQDVLSPFLTTQSNLAPDMAGSKDPLTCSLQPDNLGLTSQDVADLVAFMKTLTDERVRWESAPFDHPQLPIPNGHPTDELSVLARPGNPSMAQQDPKMQVPAVGKDGRASRVNPLGPVLPFESYLQ